MKYFALITVDVQTWWRYEHLGFDIIIEALAIFDLSGENYAEKIIENFWNIYLFLCWNTWRFNYMFLGFLGVKLA